MNVNLPDSIQSALDPLLIKLAIPADWFSDQVRIADDAMAVTDTSWKLLAGSPEPRDWTLASFDDSQWRTAVNEGYLGVAPWTPLRDFAPGSQAQWIWSGFSNKGDDRLTVYFRRKFLAPRAHATIFITADDEFTAHLDGVQIGTGNSWPTAKRILVTLTRGQEHVLAVKVVNKGGPGGLLVDIR